jgi:hypothetical protein
VQPGTNGADGNPHRFGNLVVAQLLDFAKDQRGAKLRWELIEQFLDQNPVLYVSALMRLHRFKLGGRGALQAQSIHAEPHTDTIKEACEGSVVPQPVNLAEGLEKGFLSDIFGFKAVPKQVGCGSNQAIAMSRNEQAQGDVVPTSAPVNPLELFSDCIDSGQWNGLNFLHRTFGNPIKHHSGRNAKSVSFESER